MVRKLFIVSRDRPEVLESLSRAVAGEWDVNVILDRRQPGMAASREQGERRTGPDVGDELRERGFAVVHLGPPPAPSTRPPSNRMGRRF